MKVDATEEAYFNDSDNEGELEQASFETNHPVPFKRGLVDYPDDEDDDLVVKKPIMNRSPKLKIALNSTSEPDPFPKKSRLL